MFVLWIHFPGENANRWGQAVFPSCSVPLEWASCSSAPLRRTCTIMAADSGSSCLDFCSPDCGLCSLTSTSRCSLAWIWVILSCPCNAAANPKKQEHKTCSPGKNSLSAHCHWHREQAGSIITVIPRDSLCRMALLGGTPPTSLAPIQLKRKKLIINFKTSQVKANCFT